MLLAQIVQGKAGAIVLSAIEATVAVRLLCRRIAGVVVQCGYADSSLNRLKMLWKCCPEDCFFSIGCSLLIALPERERLLMITEQILLLLYLSSSGRKNGESLSGHCCQST